MLRSNNSVRPNQIRMIYNIAMDIYHVTLADAIKSIREQGITPGNTNNCQAYVPGGQDTFIGRGLTGIYAFTDLRDAERSAHEWYGYGYAIFAISVPEGAQLLDDPEYTDNPDMFGRAVLFVTSHAAPAILVLAYPDWAR